MNPRSPAGPGADVPDPASIPFGDGMNQIPPLNRSHGLTTGRGRRLLIPERSRGEARVEPIELFFDLVFAFAATRLPHLLVGRMTPGGAGETLLLLMAI